MRTQYRLRTSERGLLAWDVHGLIEKTIGLIPFDLTLDEIRELDETFWFENEGDTPTCRKIAEHAKLIAETDLSHPIILDPDGRVMDGMHRVCKALLEGRTSILAVKLDEMPEPDFTGLALDELPYPFD